MGSEVSWSTGLSLIWVTENRISQSKTAAPLCQTLHLGVLQGSMLGSVHFLLYINDMNISSNQIRFVHFVDYTTVFASNSDINNVHATVNRELVGVDNWLKANRLSLNVNKTSHMIIYNQKNAIDIRIQDSILTKVSILSNSLALHLLNDFTLGFTCVHTHILLLETM